MSDHDFEKKVRRQLDGFKVRPSAGTWEALEQSLERQPRRRRGIIWIPLALALLTAALFTYTYYYNEPNTQQVSELPESRIDVPGNTPNNNQAAPPVSVQPQPGSSETPTKTDAVTEQADTAPASPEISLVPNDKNRETSIPPHQIVRSPSQNRAAPAEVKLLGDDDQTRTEKTQTSLPVTEQAPRRATLIASLQTVAVPDIEKAFRDQSRVLPDLISPKKASSISLAKRWSWGLTLGAGVSGVHSGELFGLKQAEVADFAQTPNSSMLPWLGITYKPAQINPGLSYTAGGYIRKEMGKRLAIAVGLNYTRLSSTVYLGSRVDSNRIANSGNNGFLNLAYYYRPEKEKKYSMNYDYIDLPLTVHYKIGAQRRLPLELSAGLVLSRLLSTSALHFDGSSGIYYENDAFVQPWQAAVQGSISTDLFRRSKAPVKIGPVFRYSVTNLLTSDLPGKNRFMSVGLEARISLNTLR